MRRRKAMLAMLAVLAVLALPALVAAGCVPGGYAGGGAPPVDRGPVWPVITRVHVDLWLHGYAMLLRDTATVPVFRRGYREHAREARTRLNVITRLDNDRERLQARLAASPGIINGQFLPFYFANWDQMRRIIDSFLSAEGDSRYAGDRAMAQYFAVLGQSFGSAADREWLRTFSSAMDDEYRRFFQTWWGKEHGTRLAHVRAVDSLWQQGGMRQRLQRFLNNTQQEAGDFVLALTLGGEGRTVNFGPRQNAIASTMPDSAPVEAIYVFVHEAVGSVVASAVNDNTTPADQRAGVAARGITMGQVRGGAMLLQRIAPELVDGYVRYYLMQAGQPVTGDLNARFASVFPIPEHVRQAIDRQLEVVLGGL